MQGGKMAGFELVFEAEGDGQPMSHRDGLDLARSQIRLYTSPDTYPQVSKTGRFGSRLVSPPRRRTASPDHPVHSEPAAGTSSSLDRWYLQPDREDLWDRVDREFLQALQALQGRLDRQVQAVRSSLVNLEDQEDLEYLGALVVHAALSVR